MIKSKNIKILTSILVISSILCTVFYSHAESFGRYNTDNNTEDIINFIKEEINKLNKNHTNTFMVGDYINNIMEFYDLEKDYKDISIEDKIKYNDDIPKEKKIPKELFAKYEHDPNVFDNPVPKNSRDNGKFNLISSIEDPFIINKAEDSMRGNWTLSLKATDDTKNLNWDKYADEKSISFIIHEKPKAIIEYWKEETDFEVYLTSENSYDIDYQYSKANNGIVKYVWKYQTKDGTWHDFLETSEIKRITAPKNIDGQAITNYSLTVYDYNNATDTTLTSISPPKLMEPEAIAVIPDYIYVGPYGSDVLEITNNSEPKSSILSYQYELDFRSVDNYLKKNLVTILNSESYTFNKNSLKYDGDEIFKKNIKLKITSIDSQIYEDTESLTIIPVTISNMESTSINSAEATLSVFVKNGNTLEHDVIATVNGIDYTMIYKGNDKWEVDVNILGAERLYARVQKKSDVSIVYDKHDILANRPPKIEVEELYPEFIYEGDKVNALIKVDDPDLETLKVEFELYKQGTLIDRWERNISPNGNIYDAFIENISNNIEVIDDNITNYRLNATVTDNFDESDSDTINFNVYPLSITGYVQHTEDWEKNRINYNLSITGSEDSPRTYDVFFPGEKFLLQAITTDIDPVSNVVADKVTASILSTPYITELTSVDNINWSGSLWDKDMLDWQDRIVTFRFTVHYSNGTIKTYDVIVNIIDDKYWRLHRKF